MMADMLRLREWPIISFSFFTLGVFAANDFGHGFVHTIGLSFLAVAVIWAVASTGRRRAEKARVRIQGLAT
jgi:apolipoprotein N-acyltransferase